MHFIQMLLVVGLFLLVIPLVSLVIALITMHFRDEPESSGKKLL